MIHLYYGDGKGKTTAAMGLALRALGHGKSVRVVQFLKDGSSGEITALRALGAAVYTDSPGTKFSWLMTEEERQAARRTYEENLYTALQIPCDLLVLDEVCDALEAGLLGKDKLLSALQKTPTAPEIVLTGHTPPDWLLDMADYLTEMRLEKHPYQHGAPPRIGIEY